MTRHDFIARLRQGLVGLPLQAQSDIVADYETHFNEGLAAGRSEADVAAALGDPDRLARELRTEVGVQRWQAQRNPEAAAAAVFAVLGLGAIDILVLLPILITVVSVLCAFGIVALVGFVAGAFVLAAGPFAHGPGGIGAALLTGLGMMAGGVSMASVVTLVSIGLVNALIWYGRLHYRLLKPAIDPQPVGEFAAS
ncbi:MAG TPA: DUF1700 domain-containing protein [Caulobacteraceae bacterium]|jgi:uncharacterized membrane protein|nr:DUF1700 domain-containing protein [Caulobacteraceae bacterium]